jgi:hypothetical protein
MRTLDIQNQFTKKVEVKNEYEAVFKDINYILSNPESCALTFQNWVADAGAPNRAIAIYFKDEASAMQTRYVGNPDLNLAPKYGNGTIQVAGVRLVPDAPFPTGELRLNTNAIFTFHYPQITQGQKRVERRIPLRIEIDASATKRIVKCSAAGLTSALDNTYLRLAGGTMRGDIIMEDGHQIIFDSDRRFKTHIEPLTHVLPRLNTIPVVSYEWRKSMKADVGFIAQDVKDVFPQVVQRGEDGHLQVDYVQFSPLMVRGLQEIDTDTTYLRNNMEKLKREQQDLLNYLKGSE